MISGLQRFPRSVTSLRRISAVIDRLNDRIGAAIQWLALVMVIVWVRPVFLDSLADRGSR